MLEVTQRTPVALACIELIAKEVPEAVAGAGTVRSAADAEAAQLAGARFAVSPGYTRSVGKACHDLGLPLLPGVATGSEIMAAQEGGNPGLVGHSIGTAVLCLAQVGMGYREIKGAHIGLGFVLLAAGVALAAIAFNKPTKTAA